MELLVSCMIFISKEIILNKNTKRCVSLTIQAGEKQQNSFQVAFTDFLYASHMQGQDPRYDLFWFGLFKSM